MDKVKQFVGCARQARNEARWYERCGQAQSAEHYRRDARDFMRQARSEHTRNQPKGN